MRKFRLILGLTACILLVGCSSAANRTGDAAPLAYLNIALGSNCFEGYCWSYTASPPGLLLEVPYETVVPQTSQVNPEGTISISQELIPGNQHFFFLGVSAGEVELDFVRSSPGGDQPSATARYQVAVLPDLTLKILSSQEDLGR